jgi:hypothetical protein
MVEYEVDGSAQYADITWNNASAATEQDRVSLPFHQSFLAPVGGFGVSGPVHVGLHIIFSGEGRCEVRRALWRRED